MYFPLKNPANVTTQPSQNGCSITQPTYREAVTYPVGPVRYIQNPEEASQYYPEYPQYSRDTAFAAASTFPNTALPHVSAEMSNTDSNLYCESQTAGAMTQTFSPLRIPPSVSSQDFQCIPEIPADLQSIQTAEKDEQHKTLPQASLDNPEKTETESTDTPIQPSCSSRDIVKETPYEKTTLKSMVDSLAPATSMPLTTEPEFINPLELSSAELRKIEHFLSESESVSPIDLISYNDGETFSYHPSFSSVRKQDTYMGVIITQKDNSQIEKNLHCSARFSHTRDFTPCIDGATFSYRPSFSSVRKLDPDIEILFTEKDRNQKEKHLQSLARFMGNLPSFKETSQKFLEAKTLFTSRSKKKKRSRAKPPTSSLTPEIYIDRVMCPVKKGKVVFCQMHAGPLKPYIVPHLATPALKTHLMSIDSHLRNILKLEPDYHCTSASLRSLAGMGQVRAAM